MPLPEDYPHNRYRVGSTDELRSQSSGWNYTQRIKKVHHISFSRAATSPKLVLQKYNGPLSHGLYTKSNISTIRHPGSPDVTQRLEPYFYVDQIRCLAMQCLRRQGEWRQDSGQSMPPPIITSCIYYLKVNLIKLPPSKQDSNSCRHHFIFHHNLFFIGVSQWSRCT